MTVSVSDLYLILFYNIKGIGVKKLEEIYKKFGNFQIAYNAPFDDFKGLFKDEKLLSNINEFLNNRDNIIEKVKKTNELLKKKSIRYISYFNKNYPLSLRDIENPPIGLYIKGELIFNELKKSVSIIGTRDPSFYGHLKARKISKGLAKKGYIIISGLARGIDIESHIGALEGGGKTIAVLGSGVDNIFPIEHKNLANDIINNGGAIISESDINQKSTPYNLINRNRIISALSEASLIIEGNLKSGTNHEVNFAKAQNKRIFALKPIEPSREVSKLSLSLIRNGAIEIINHMEIINYLNSNPNRKELRNIVRKDIFDYIKN